jgi:hypothetical protein
MLGFIRNVSANGSSNATTRRASPQTSVCDVKLNIGPRSRNDFDVQAMRRGVKGV